MNIAWRPDWSIRDYAEQTPNIRLMDPAIIQGLGGDAFARVLHSDRQLAGPCMLLVEQDRGDMQVVHVVYEGTINLVRRVCVTSETQP